MLPFRLENLSPINLLGLSVNTTFAAYDPVILWRRFMPLQSQIANKVPGYLYALQKYPDSFDFADFAPEVSIDMWAAVALSGTASFEHPEALRSLRLPGGLYAVFVYKGHPAHFSETARAIHTEYLPGAGYIADNTRYHFALMGERYRNDSPDSEEEIWVPVKPLFSEV